MFKIVLKNKNGSFEIGGGSHPTARLESINGIGLLNKEVQSVKYVGQAGRTQTSIRDNERTITMSFNFYGDTKIVEQLYKILYNEVDIIITSGIKRQKITGQCLNATEIEKIIYHKWQKIAVQFVCNDPYFHDVDLITIPIAKRVDKFPNYQNNDGKWLIQLPAVATERIAKSIVENRGEVLIYPVIVLYNQSDVQSQADLTFEVINNTTGAKITFDYSMSTDEIITVDLPHRKITSSVNGDITNRISDDTVLSDFYLAVGDNEISATVNDTNTALSMTMQYSNSYGAVVI